MLARWLVVLLLTIGTSGPALASPEKASTLLKDDAGTLQLPEGWTLDSVHEGPSQFDYRFTHQGQWSLDVRIEAKVPGARLYRATRFLVLSYNNPDFEPSANQKEEIESFMAWLTTQVEANEKEGLLLPPKDEERAPVKDAWLDLIRTEGGEVVSIGEGWTLLTAFLADDRLTYLFVGNSDREIRVFIAPKKEGQPAFASTHKYNIWYSSADDLSSSQEQSIDEGLQVLVSLVQANEGKVSLFTEGTNPSSLGAPSSVSPFLLVVDFVLLGLWLLVLGLLLVLAVQRLRKWGRLDVALIVALMFLGALVRGFLAVPGLVKIGMFFPVMDSAISLSDFPRYGVVGPAMYHVLMDFLPIQVDTVLAFHGVLSVLNLGLWYLVVRELFGVRFVAAFVALFAALTPVVWHHDVSESLLVPAQTFFLSGVLLLEMGRRSGKLLPLLGAAISLALATHVRPEFTFLVLLWAGLTVLFHRKGLVNRRGVLALGLLVLLWIPYALFQSEVIAMEIGHGNVFWSHYNPLSLLHNLGAGNLVLRHEFYPVLVTLLAAPGIWFGIRNPATRSSTVRISLLALVWIIVYFLDFNAESMLRLHVPAGICVAVLGGLGLSEILKRIPTKPWQSAVLVLVAVLYGITAFSNISFWRSSSNSRAEEEVFEAAVTYLPEETVNFVVLGWGDPPNLAWSKESFEKIHASDLGTATVHRNYPTYLLNPPLRSDKVFSIKEYMEQPNFKRRTFFFLSATCYAMRENHGYKEWPTDPAPYLTFHPACRTMLTHYELEPVYLDNIPNYPETAPQFRWVPPELSRMTLGLFEVHERLDKPRTGDTFSGISRWIFSKAKEHLLKEELPEAEEILDAGYKVLPDSPTMWEMMGSYYYLKGSLDEKRETLDYSMEFWSKLADKDPFYPFLLKQFGSVFGHYTKFLTRDERDAFIADRLKDNPDDLVGLYLKGMFLYYDKNYEESLKVLTTVHDRIKTDPRVYVYLSLVHFFLGHQSQAEKLIARGIEVARELDPDVYYVRSIVYRRKDLQMAADDIRRYLTMSEGADKVRSDAKTAWLLKELVNVEKGNPSSWWDEDLASEPWTEK